MNKSLEIRNVFEMLQRMDDFLSVLEKENDESKKVVSYLSAVVKHTVSHHENSNTIEQLLIDFTDYVYIIICLLKQRDKWVDVYFSVFVRSFFLEMKNKGYVPFYIIDNELRDDRLKLVKELYELIGFEIVTPYKLDNLNYSLNYTHFEVLSKDEIINRIQESLSYGKPILYVEKPDVDFLDTVFQAAKKVEDRYTIIFRNKAYDSREKSEHVNGKT